MIVHLQAIWKCTPGGFLLAAVLCSLLAPARLPAQTTQGTIQGEVRDVTGAVRAGARLLLREAQKNLDYHARTDSLGKYQFIVPGGEYVLEVSEAQFASQRSAPITLSIGQTRRVDFSLAPAGQSDVFEVLGTPPLVETTSSTLANLVSRERLAALPLNGRDFGQLALLQPGVVANANGANSPFGGRWATFVINGQLDQSTLFLNDGSELNDLASGRNPSGSSGLLLGLDSVQEFQVLLNNYKAEFGKNSGGVIHVATRSGTNTLHGALFEYLRNSALDAKNFFDLPDRPIPSFRRNQFGASLGGPLRRDRTFYFLSYEGLRERKAITSVATVPAAELRAGAAANVLPFLNLYPLPNGPLNADGRTASLTTSLVQPAREDFGLVRMDHRLLNEWNVNAKFSTQDSLVEPPYASTPVPGFPQSLPHRITNALVGVAAPFSEHLLGEMHFAFNRTYGAIELPPPPGGLLITPVPGRNFGLVNVTGISNLGTQTFVPRAAQNLFETVAQLAHHRGAHSLKYGVNVQRYQDNELRGTFFNGQYNFVGLTQFLAGTPATWLGVLDGTHATGPASPAGWRWTTTSAFAQDDWQLTPRLTLNLGLRYEFSGSPTDVLGQIANLRSPLDPEITYGGQFFNTIARSFAPRFGFALDPRGGTSAAGRSALRGGFGIFYNPLVVNMWANSRLVPPFVNTVLIPGGPPFPNPLATGRAPVASSTGQALDFNLSQPYTMQYSLEWQQELGAGWVARVAYAGNRSLHILRSLESNAGTPVILADGRKCFNFAAAAGGPNALCPAGSTVRRNLNFGPIRGRSSDGRSWYDSLQLTAERRIAGGSTLQASYTWSKAISTNNSSFTTFPSQPSNTQDPDDIYLDKAVSSFDVRQRLAAHAILALPALASGRAGWVVNGWRAALIGSLSSGYPFTVVDGFNRSQNLQTDVALADRPDWAAGATAESALKGARDWCSTAHGASGLRFDPCAFAPQSGEQRFSRFCIAGGQPRFGGRKVGGPELYFDPCAFALQPNGFYGNVGRNTLTGPGFFNVDLSLSRSFPLREQRQLEFRADFFNLLNRPNFSTPSSPTGAQVSAGALVFPDATGVPAGNAGQIFRTVNDSRQIQFSLRYSF